MQTEFKGKLSPEIYDYVHHILATAEVNNNGMRLPALENATYSDVLPPTTRAFVSAIYVDLFSPVPGVFALHEDDAKTAIIYANANSEIFERVVGCPLPNSARALVLVIELAMRAVLKAERGGNGHPCGDRESSQYAPRFAASLLPLIKLVRRLRFEHALREMDEAKEAARYARLYGQKPEARFAGFVVPGSRMEYFGMADDLFLDDVVEDMPTASSEEVARIWRASMHNPDEAREFCLHSWNIINAPCPDPSAPASLGGRA